MSLTQTYMMAHLSRKQLSKEAARPDHDLRRLVGHANMLDNLMLDLAHAEEEQESWFNQTVQNADKASEESKHVRWADKVPEDVFDDEEEEEEEEDEDDSDYDVISDEEETGSTSAVPVRIVRRTSTTTVTELENEEDEDDDEMETDDDYEEDLALTRTSSRHPPDLMHEDSDSESEDDSMPPSPPTTEIPFPAFSDKQRQAIATSSFYNSDKSIQQSDQGYYLPQRETAIAAF